MPDLAHEPVQNAFPRHEDLRDLLVDFERMGELARVDGADSHVELGALAETLTARYPGVEPALMFDKIEGFPEGWRILAGAASSYKRLAHVLGLPAPENRMDFVRAYKARLGRTFEMIPPRTVKAGPVLQNVWRETEVDLDRFPVPFIHERDGGRYIGTEDVVIMRDPDSGWVNLGTYRVQVHSKTTCGVWMSPGKHGRLIREKYFSRGLPCPIAISCGQDPLLYLSANSELAEGVSEYDHAGGQRGRPFEVLESELHGLPIPAAAEIVLEGEMIPGETALEGPFGEFMGYYASEASQEPLIRIRRVYFRNDPIMTLAIPARPPANFTVIRAAGKAAMIWNECERAGLAGIQGVWCHEAAAGRLFNVISIQQKYPGHAKQAGMLAANCQSGAYSGRWVVVVDHDIDPSNIHDVIWAMSTRCDPPNDIDYVRGAWSTPLDPMLTGPPWENNRAVVNACRPWGRLSSFPPVAEASPELKAQVMRKWAHLFRGAG